jgi:hypothetical protein
MPENESSKKDAAVTTPSARGQRRPADCSPFLGFLSDSRIGETFTKRVRQFAQNSSLRLTQSLRSATRWRTDTLVTVSSPTLRPS